MWSTHPLSAVFASLIAVVGTLLGSLSTFLFQQRTAVRAEVSAREERLRQERLAAYSAFAAAVTELKRGVVAAWLRRSDPGGHGVAPAEADRLGAFAEAARFRLLLVSGRPEPLADAAFAHMDTLGGAQVRQIRAPSPRLQPLGSRAVRPGLFRRG